MKQMLTWASIGIFSVVLCLFTPITQTRVISYGVDTYAAHKPLFGLKTLEQTITTQSRITAIGTILVDLRKTNQLTDMRVNLFDADTNEPIASSSISKQLIKDDTFTYADFSQNPTEKGKKIIIQFSAPDATIKNPIGLRFDPKNGQFALALQERMPLWKALITIANNNKEQWQYALVAAGLSLLVAIPAFIKKQKHVAWIIALLIICAFSYTTMIQTLSQFGGVSGGDPYNYLFITQAIIHFDNPFLNTKRMPGYPLLLVPTYISGAFDDQLVMRIFSATAGIWGIIMLACIARALTTSWPVAIAASAILAFQKDYIWTAMRPEPYALYTALLLTALYFFLTSYKKISSWRYTLFGLFLGYAAMTRQEGFVLAVVLGVCSLAYELYQRTWRTSAIRFCMMYLPALLLVLPFFISNTVHYGTPFYAEYLEGERLQIVNSFLMFQDSLGATWGIIGSMWKTSWDQLERLPLPSPTLIISALGLMAWYACTRFFLNSKTKIALTVLLPVIWVAVLLGSIYMKSATSDLIMHITAGFILASIPLFLIQTKWRGFVIILVLISQLGIATWFHPFPKHYEQSYPLIVLMIATALFSRVPKKGFFTGITLMTAILPFFIIAMLLGQKINAAIDKQNEDTALDSVIYRAVRYARTLPKPIGLDQAYLPARLYLDPEAKYFPAEETPTVEMEQAWLLNNLVKTLIVSNGDNVFKIPNPAWKVIKTFKSAGDDEKIFTGTVYDTGY